MFSFKIFLYLFSIPSSEVVDDPNFWEPYARSTGYLQITKDPDLSLTIEQEFSSEKMEFWKAYVFKT